MISFSDQQVGLNHVPNRLLGSVSVMGLSSLSVEPIRTLNMVGGPGAVDVIKEGDGLLELFWAERSDDPLEGVGKLIKFISDDLLTLGPGFFQGLVSREEVVYLQDKVSDQAEASISFAQLSDDCKLSGTQLLIPTQECVTEIPYPLGILLGPHSTRQHAPKVVDGRQDVLGNGAGVVEDAELVADARPHLMGNVVVDRGAIGDDDVGLDPGLPKVLKELLHLYLIGDFAKLDRDRLVVERIGRCQNRKVVVKLIHHKDAGEPWTAHGS